MKDKLYISLCECFFANMNFKKAISMHITNKICIDWYISSGMN